MHFTKMQGLGNDYLYGLRRSAAKYCRTLGQTFRQTLWGRIGWHDLYFALLPLPISKCEYSMLTAVKQKCAATESAAWASMCMTRDTRIKRI